MVNPGDTDEGKPERRLNRKLSSLARELDPNPSLPRCQLWTDGNLLSYAPKRSLTVDSIGLFMDEKPHTGCAFWQSFNNHIDLLIQRDFLGGRCGQNDPGLRSSHLLDSDGLPKQEVFIDNLGRFSRGWSDAQGLP
jgi:hypothetical protein